MNTTNLSDGTCSPDAIRSYVHLADGRRLSYTEWGQPAGRPVLEFRGLPSSHTGDAIDMAVLARAGVQQPESPGPEPRGDVVHALSQFAVRQDGGRACKQLIEEQQCRSGPSRLSGGATDKNFLTSLCASGRPPKSQRVISAAADAPGQIAVQRRDDGRVALAHPALDIER